MDWDSTVSVIEGLNNTAVAKGLGEQVKKLTQDSMDGLIPVEDVMPLKMDLIRPSRDDIRALSENYLTNLAPDAREVIQELQRAGKRVVIITGNFHEAVDPVARELGLDPAQDVYANNLLFDESGNYAGYVENYRLMHDDGKQRVVDLLRQKYKHVTHVGDSMGDLQAGADRFIGCGVAVVRPPVLAMSGLYIASEIPSLAPILSVELSRRQLRHIPDRSLAERAQSGLLIRRTVRQR